MAVSGVAQHDRHALMEFEGGPHLLGFIVEGAVELIDRHEELDAAVLESDSL